MSDSATPMGDSPTIAYFSMEIALESAIPTYSGGLGVLAGDSLRSAADLALPMVAVTLVHRKGYFQQRLDESGWQVEEPAQWHPERRLRPLSPTCPLSIEGRRVAVRAWRYAVPGVSGAVLPVILLDTDLPENEPADRSFTDYLYGGDERYRLCQEQILGVGGMRMLRALGFTRVARYHMNEGHSALLALELFSEAMERKGDTAAAVEEVKRRCTFTTHTPVSAGHDRFPMDLVRAVLTPTQVESLGTLGHHGDTLSMTGLGLDLSGYVNGVTKRHASLSRALFPGHSIRSITNGVHSVTWTSEAFRRLFDDHISDWREDNLALRHALLIPADEVWNAHQSEKRKLVDEVNRRAGGGAGASAGADFTVEAFTMGAARRATSYKRPTLLLQDLERLKKMAGEWGPLQIVYAGKAHPRDSEGKELIRHILDLRAAAGPSVKLAYLPDYNMDLAKVLTAGVDLWLNTPKPPLEASGTSGMKAAHNGVPSLSVLDGWWLEGHAEEITGWSIGARDNGTIRERPDVEDAQDLYRALEERILPLYHREPQRWRELMRFVIALNASFFNTQRMMQEYVVEAYRDVLLPSPPEPVPTPLPE